MVRQGFWLGYPTLSGAELFGRAPLFVNYHGETLTRDSLKCLYSTSAYTALELDVTSREMRRIMNTALLKAETEGGPAAPPPVLQVLGHGPVISRTSHYNNEILNVAPTCHILMRTNPGLNPLLEPHVVAANAVRDVINNELVSSLTRKRKLAQTEAAAWQGKPVSKRCRVSGRVRREVVRSLYSLSDPVFSQILLCSHHDLKGSDRQSAAWVQRIASFVNNPANTELRAALLDDMAPFSQAAGESLYSYLLQALRRGAQAWDPSQEILLWRKVTSYFN